MATSFKTLNTSFLAKITDTWLAGLTDAELATQCTLYRNAAIPKFRKCKTDLSLIDINGFTSDLTGEEIEILANYMVLEWLKPQMNTVELIRQGLGSKNFQMYSQANHLKELSELRRNTQMEVDQLLVAYTYNNNSLDGLEQ